MKIALVGNPNSGKTSIFNLLTGLNQKVGNYPGITVDKKTGRLLSEDHQVDVLDLPGTYSVYPKSRDEEIVYEVLSNKEHPDHPDLVVVILDVINLERNLFLATQVQDMGVPIMLAANMTDVADRKGVEINYEKLSELLGGVKIVTTSARTGNGLQELKKAIFSFDAGHKVSPLIPDEFVSARSIPSDKEQTILGATRYKKINALLKFCLDRKKDLAKKHNQFDRMVTHPVWGYVIFIGILMVIFQAIYAWSEWPMDLIDGVFLSLSQLTKASLPEGVFTNLIAEGIIPGLGGVMIFIPQIAMLFAFIFLLEESGYMARVVFITDRLMRPFGLNGRSVVPMISAVACAIPAVMATRTIDNWKERIITIMVAPLMSCSARLPVYTLLIALVIPDESMGIFNLKGLVLMGLYLIGLVAALAVALLFKLILKSRKKSFLVMELPNYKMPRWSNMGITVLEKVKIFVWEAGKVIMAISIILWVMASYGPGNRIEQAVSQIEAPQDPNEMESYERLVASVALENSYIGILGKWIEPTIAPLGYNWQIGISLITSFAAREVFVGSMATIYSVGENFEEDNSLLKRMGSQLNAKGEPVYSIASGISLMLFYAFAMQCMSTLAVVYRETKSWKWPLIQLGYMTVLAYLSALVAYNLLS